MSVKGLRSGSKNQFSDDRSVNTVNTTGTNSVTKTQANTYFQDMKSSSVQELVLDRVLTEEERVRNSCIEFAENSIETENPLNNNCASKSAFGCLNPKDSIGIIDPDQNTLSNNIANCIAENNQLKGFKETCIEPENFAEIAEEVINCYKFNKYQLEYYTNQVSLGVADCYPEGEKFDICLKKVEEIFDKNIKNCQEINALDNVLTTPITSAGGISNRAEKCVDTTRNAANNAVNNCNIFNGISNSTIRGKLDINDKDILKGPSSNLQTPINFCFDTPNPLNQLIGGNSEGVVNGIVVAFCIGLAAGASVLFGVLRCEGLIGKVKDSIQMALPVANGDSTDNTAHDIELTTHIDSSNIPMVQAIPERELSVDHQGQPGSVIVITATAEVPETYQELARRSQGRGL